YKVGQDSHTRIDSSCFGVSANSASNTASDRRDGGNLVVVRMTAAAAAVVVGVVSCTEIRIGLEEFVKLIVDVVVVAVYIDVAVDLVATAGDVAEAHVVVVPVVVVGEAAGTPAALYVESSSELFV